MYLLLDDERYGNPRLIEEGNLQEFLDSMEKMMFEFDYDNPATEREQRKGWRMNLENALKLVNPVKLPDGRIGYTYDQCICSVYGSETYNLVYVKESDGTAKYLGDLEDMQLLLGEGIK